MNALLPGAGTVRAQIARDARLIGESSSVLVQHDGALAAQRFEQALRVYIYIMCVCIRAHEYTITGRMYGE